ncbi:hypothetical protein N0V83_005621 [Neocucurbitaria cava]|uniref:Zn(2)-C6 fungal-type domain-containing protein n=1 Tax=Neocucurbitaria cava TaxID=798079 RepID=A0A9W8Y879_9PLEO|nr:hypothetical protein N0V83_005621 [Neocucurbitaria cava]
MSTAEETIAGLGLQDATSATSKKRTHPDDFKRAYKACINCRQRKAKCILGTGPDGGELKPPCQRCKREMRECIFRSERSWVKRRKPGETRDDEDEEAGQVQSNPAPVVQPSPGHRSSISVHGATPTFSPRFNGSHRSGILSPGHLRRISTSQPDLAHSVMRTVVSSGSDALNLLFEAAHHRDAIDSQEQSGSQAYETPRSLGQVKPSKAQSRTIGSIEALLLLSEWHPRALHFPTAADGWDCELMIGANNTTEEGSKLLEGDATSSRWLEDVIEPAKRSDRMSWMLMGCALSLAQELGLFEDNASIDKDQVSYPKFTTEFLILRRIRARKLLYVLLEQLSWRLGCTSMIPQSLNHALMEKIPVDSATGAVEQWQSFMSAWVELTKLARSVSDTIYPSTATTRSLLRTGRYIGLLEHFQPLLTSWRKKYLDPCKLKVGLHDMLHIEYQYVRIYTNSLGMQAVVERTLAETDPDVPQEDNLPFNLEPRDYDFIQEVVDGSCQILQKVCQLSETGALRYSPVRIFLRITTSSIYLIKGLSLGSRNQKLQSSLDILDAAIRALRASTLDDMHLASRYATLLDLHVARLRESFVVSSRPPRLPSRATSADVKSATTGMDFLNNHNAGQSSLSSLAENVTGLMPDDDWLALPFDPAMAPFGLDNQQSFQGFDDGTLDFIWNLPM